MGSARARSSSDAVHYPLPGRRSATGLLRLDPVWVSRRFHALADGLPCIRLHDVRHSWATAALGAGVPLKVVSERLGHSSVSITADTYQHVTEGLDRQAADTVARLILGVSKP